MPRTLTWCRSSASPMTSAAYSVAPTITRFGVSHPPARHERTRSHHPRWSTSSAPAVSAAHVQHADSAGPRGSTHSLTSTAASAIAPAAATRRRWAPRPSLRTKRYRRSTRSRRPSTSAPTTNGSVDRNGVDSSAAGAARSAATADMPVMASRSTVRNTCELSRLLWLARTVTSRCGRSGPRRAAVSPASPTVGRSVWVSLRISVNAAIANRHRPQRARSSSIVIRSSANGRRLRSGHAHERGTSDRLPQPELRLVEQRAEDRRRARRAGRCRALPEDAAGRGHAARDHRPPRGPGHRPRATRRDVGQARPHRRRCGDRGPGRRPARAAQAAHAAPDRGQGRAGDHRPPEGAASASCWPEPSSLAEPRPGLSGGVCRSAAVRRSPGARGAAALRRARRRGSSAGRSR